jgi:hypothetical protein
MSDNFSSVVDSAASDDFVSIEKQFAQMMQARLNDTISAQKVDFAKHIFAGPYEAQPKSDDEKTPETELTDDEINNLLDTINGPEDEEEKEEEPDEKSA